MNDAFASDSHPNASRLVIVLNGILSKAPESMSVPLRYAMTAAAMDVAVEMHAVSQGVALFRRGSGNNELLVQIRQAVELGVEIFACPVALAEQGMTTKDLIEEVTGVRGAASLIAAGFEPRARFLVF